MVLDEKDFLLSSYTYNLPPERIAQFPPEEKGASKLLVINREESEDRLDKDTFIDASFGNLADYLPAGTMLVANNTKVLPARIMGRRPGGGKVEFLLLTPLPLVLDTAGKNAWRIQKDGMESVALVECLLRPSAKIRPGDTIRLGENLCVSALKKGEYGKWEAHLFWHGDLEAIFSVMGKLPLPPYIKREPQNSDADRYQTVYAKITGSVAAPTAGLHFTRELSDKLAGQGFAWEEVTLHVGYGTFSPVRCDDIRQHKMHREFVEISPRLANAVREARAEGRPVVAVGTTSLRALEGAVEMTGELGPFSGWTDIFLYPGKEFKVVDGLITNFHLPQSSLLLLVAAFAGRRRILHAYAHAIENGYRFFSYGDAMLIR